jgi:hypothetical protein
MYYSENIQLLHKHSQEIVRRTPCNMRLTTTRSRIEN